MTAKRTAHAHTADNDRPYRGRRLTWAEFYQLRPDRKPANDNEPVKPATAKRRARGHHPLASHFNFPTSRWQNQS